jgi:hypothetical protein
MRARQQHHAGLVEGLLDAAISAAPSFISGGRTTAGSLINQIPRRSHTIAVRGGHANAAHKAEIFIVQARVFAEREARKAGLID